MSKAVFVTEKLFNAVKILIKGGADTKEVMEYMDISASTVTRIRQHETYEDFVAYKKAKAFAAKKAVEAKKAEEERKAAEEAKKVDEKKLPPQPSPIVLPQHRPISGEDSYQLVRLMKEQNELLTLISNKLAFIVDELVGPVKKEG